MSNNIRDWKHQQQMNKKNIHISDISSSSLTNLRITPGNESLSNAVRLRQHSFANKLINDDLIKSHSILLNENNNKTNKLFNLRFVYIYKIFIFF